MTRTLRGDARRFFTHSRPVWVALAYIAVAGCGLAALLVLVFGPVVLISELTY
ncbi:MAG: hypothetical protein JWO98_5301 [Frankiales bacterium]|nr:hypothetical protein [Frankiales bacterium]